jgi:predicted RNA binding protein YcfA (HicA-like mRNA interferase family)
VAGQEIKATGEHPFWVQGKGWTAVNQLQPGDKLRGDDGQLYPVESVTATDSWLPVYNARIADYHTYYVCAPGGNVWLWAHNQGCPFIKAEWGKNRVIKELHKRGFVLLKKTKKGEGLIYRHPQTGEQVRIMPRPSHRWRNDPPAKHQSDWYYRYHVPGKPEGPHIPIPS